MSDQPPVRVRVTAPPRRRTPLPRARDLDQDTPLGGLYLTSLLRDQLWLALRVLGVLTISLGSLPLLVHLWPAIGRLHVAGLPLPWLVLGVLAYPWLLLLGWRYVRRAERNEEAFADLVRERER